MKDNSRLFIVDDHQMFIDGITALLRKSKEF
jgi:DNA-binding NarL/FixJ family response regulator